MSHDNHEPGQCDICRKITDVRWKNIYWIGSEGLTVCMKCELKIVRFVQDLRNEQIKKEVEKRSEGKLKK